MQIFIERQIDLLNRFQELVSECHEIPHFLQRQQLLDRAGAVFSAINASLESVEADLPKRGQGSELEKAHDAARQSLDQLHQSLTRRP